MLLFALGASSRSNILKAGDGRLTESDRCPDPLPVSCATLNGGAGRGGSVRPSDITCTHMSKVVRLATIARGGGHKRHINSKNLTGHATQHTTGTPSKACTPCMGGRRDTAGSCPSDSRPRSRRGWEGAAAAPAERRRPAAARTEARSSLPAGHSAVETAVHTNYRAARWKMGAGM